MERLDIGEVARRAGVTVATLRFYEEKGLVVPIARHGLRRVYDARVLQRLALIALGRTAGFSLDEIGGMFAPDGQPRLDRAQLRAKADELERTIAQLAAVRDGLRHAAACKAPSHAECPTFQRMLQRALAGDLVSTLRETPPSSRARKGAPKRARRRSA